MSDDGHRRRRGRGAAAQGAARRLRRRRRLARGRRPAGERGGHGRLPRPPRPRHDPDVRRARPARRRRDARRARPAARPVRPRPRRRRGPRARRRGCTWSRRGRCATRSSAPTRCSTSGASRWRSSPGGRSRRALARAAHPLPAHRLLPVALVAPERQLVVAPVCGARTLSEGRPPLGIACAQQDLARIYPLPDDPGALRSREFVELAAEHARGLAERLAHQEASVARFLEMSGEDPPTLH